MSGLLSSEPPAGEGTPASDGDSGATEAKTESSIGISDDDARVVERVDLPPPKSRRAAAAETVTKQFEELKSTFTKGQEEFRKELAQRDQEIARMRGHLDAVQPILQRAGQPAAPAAPDPAQLRKEALAALDRNDFNGYQEKFSEAIRVETIAAVQRSLPQQQPGLPPVVQALLSQHPAVMNAGNRGLSMASAYDNVLAAQGIPDGPERYRRAFEMAQADLGGPPKASFSSSAQQRDSLAGIPTGRGSTNAQAGERAPGVELNEHDLKWMRAADMTKEEFVDAIQKHAPHRIVR